jgi:flagellar motility protein MotE (MotC chaperone)
MSKIPRLLPLIAVAIGGVVVVRAVGIAPGLFEGAQAWAEEAVPAAAAAAVKPAAAVCALTPEQLAQQAGISPAELRILQSLQSRRTQLDARDTDLASMLPLMATAEQKLDARVQALEAVKAEVQQLLGQVSEQEKAENDRLVAVYTAMRPKEAARVFATLSDDVRLPVAAAMRPRSLAAVMAQMEPAAARELTEKLARRFAARQQLAARAATAATANAPAPAPAAVPTANAAPSAVATPPAPTPAAAPATATPTPRPAVRRTPSRPTTPRPATQTPRPTPAPAAAAPSGPQPYQAGEAAPTPPRQSVQ